jgi:hypothetical protein
VASTTKIETTSPAVAKTFKYEDTIKNPNNFDKSGQPINGWDQSYLKDKELPDNSPASIKVVKEYMENEITRIKSENLTLMKRMTESEITEVAKAENALLIIENIVSVVRLLNSWMKTLMPDLK